MRRRSIARFVTLVWAYVLVFASILVVAEAKTRAHAHSVTAYKVLAPPANWTLTVESVVSGNYFRLIDFTVNGTTHKTPWSDSLPQGTYTVVMHSNWTLEKFFYRFDHWENDSTDPTRVIHLTADTSITAYYEYIPPTHNLSVDSAPITGIEFTINDATEVTPWTDDLTEDYYTVVMPATWNGYDFDHWENNSTDRIRRRISLIANMTVTAYYVAKYWTLTVNSQPISGIDFTVNGTTHGTHWSDSLSEGTYTIVMPSEHTVGADVYNFDHWEDDSTNPTRTVSLTATTTVTATYELYVVPDGWIDGHVTDAETDEALVGATVTANGFSDLTGADGYYKIEVAPGTYTVTASKSGYDDSVVSGVTVASGVTTTKDFDLEPLKAPVASFTYEPQEPIVGEEVDFNSTSTDPDGTIVGWEWDFDDDGVVDATTENATHTYDVAGTYNVTLTVTDDDSLTNSTSASITISPPTPPVASFTYEPIEPFLNQNATFDASASTPDGGNLTDPDSYAWDFESDGIIDGYGMNVTHAYAAYGNFTVTLNVTDSEGAWNATTDTVRVYPRSPVANFTFSPSTLYINETVTFNATESYDPDGDIVWYYWSFGDDTYLNATEQTANHTYVDDGTYTVTLVVSDDEALNGTASQNVTVVNRSPVADFTESAEAVLTNSLIYFDASGSYDPDGSIVSYFWDFGDATNATGVTVDHAYADDGVYTVALTVTDDDGDTASMSAVKTVSNRPPIASFTENATTVDTGETIHFDASGSNDPDGSIISYFWGFGDGTNAMGVTADHAYADDGTYTVTLTVTDDDGETALKSAVKTVSNRPPVASFTENASAVDIDDLIRFDASGSYDPDGSILSYFWDFDDGGRAHMVVVLDHAYTVGGNYTVTLTVTDDDGVSSVVSATISVKAPSGWPLALIAGVALGISAPTGIAIYVIYRRRKRLAREIVALEEKPIGTPNVPIESLCKECGGERDRLVDGLCFDCWLKEMTVKRD